LAQHTPNAGRTEIIASLSGGLSGQSVRQIRHRSRVQKIEHKRSRLTRSRGTRTLPRTRTLLSISLILFFIALNHAHSQTNEKVGPDPYNVDKCREYLIKLKPGYRLQEDAYQPEWKPNGLESWVWDKLCSGYSVVTYSELATPAYDSVIHGDLIKAIFASNQFDAPGYERITIRGFEIVGPLRLSGTHLRNTVRLIDCTFDDDVDFDFVSTEHVLDLSGSEFHKTLNLKGFRSTQSLFLSSTTSIAQSMRLDRRRVTMKFSEGFAESTIELTSLFERYNRSHKSGVMVLPEYVTYPNF
jgi:hypothetical protein